MGSGGLNNRKIRFFEYFDLGRPGQHIAKTSFHYWISNRKIIVSKQSVNNRYLRGGGQIGGGGGGSENLNLQPTKKRIETSIKSYQRR